MPFKDPQDLVRWRAANVEKIIGHRKKRNLKRNAKNKVLHRTNAQKRIRRARRKERARIARIAKARRAINLRWSRLILYAPSREARESFRSFKPDFEGAGL